MQYCTVNWTASSKFGTYRICEQRRFRRACASAQSRQNLRCSLIQAVSSRGTFRQKARSLAPLNGWACAVKVCHDGMLEDTNSLDRAQMMVQILAHLQQVFWLSELFYIPSMHLGFVDLLQCKKINFTYL